MTDPNPHGFTPALEEICRERCASFGDPPCWRLPDMVEPCEQITPCPECWTDLLTAAEALERVRAEEREQCAEVADTYATAWDADPSDDYFQGWIRAAERIAATIRARGETKKAPGD